MAASLNYRRQQQGQPPGTSGGGLAAGETEPLT